MPSTITRKLRPAIVPPTLAGRRRAARRINRLLGQRYPDARCELDFRTPYQLLLATVLSAQTTDVRVNHTLPTLLARFPDPQALAAADPEVVEQILQPLGFFRAKTRAVIGLAQGLVAVFDGQVPGTMKQLVTLPGVGRKTANVLLGNAFGVPGITVDTHLGRLARRFGWTTSTDPDQVEADLAQLFERKDWTLMSHRVIWHGRRICHAKKPACGACPVAGLCPSYGVGETDPVKAELLVRTGPPA